MKPIHFSNEKEKLLVRIRKVSFNDVTKAINKGKVVDIIDHPNKNKYPNKRIFILKVKNYIIAVPFVENRDEIFLKTIYRSHKYTKKYLKTLNKKYEKTKKSI